MAIHGLLFDFDGTLADTARAERDGWPGLARVIRARVPAVDLDELRARYDVAFEPHWSAYLEGRLDFAAYRRRRLSDAVAPWCEVDDELFDAYRLEKRRTVEQLRLFADARPTLRGLRADGYRVGLLTNGPSELQRLKLSLTRIEPELDAIAISEELGVAKPAAEAFHAAARMIGCAPEETAMVGDSPLYDVDGALAAGLAAAVLVREVPEPLPGLGVPVVGRLGEVRAALGL